MGQIPPTPPPPMRDIKQLRSDIKAIVSKGIAEAQGVRRHNVGECQDCKWWPQDYEMPLAWQQCGWIKDDGNGRAYAINLIAIGNVSLPVLVTAPDFGCVQWEDKKEEGCQSPR